MFSLSAYNPCRNVVNHLLTTRKPNLILRNCFKVLEEMSTFGSLTLAGVASIIQVATVAFAIVSASTGVLFIAVVLAGTALAALAFLLAIAAAIFHTVASSRALNRNNTEKAHSKPASNHRARTSSTNNPILITSNEALNKLQKRKVKIGELKKLIIELEEQKNQHNQLCHTDKRTTEKIDIAAAKIAQLTQEKGNVEKENVVLKRALKEALEKGNVQSSNKRTGNSRGNSPRNYVQASEFSDWEILE